MEAPGNDFDVSFLNVLPFLPHVSDEGSFVHCSP
jgi:hypothetical protein